MTGKLLLIPKLKGGSGASTLCRELAAGAVAHGLRVALIDLDGQGSLTGWWNRRTRDLVERADVNPALLHLGAEQIPAAAEELCARFELTIIDSPPSVHDAIRAVAEAVDLAVVPCRPTVDDLDAVRPIVRLIRGAADFAFVLTQVPGGRRSRDGAEAAEMLAKLAPVLGRTSQQLAYPRPAAIGRTAYEEGGSAREEIEALWAALTERLDITSEAASMVPLSRQELQT